VELQLLQTFRVPSETLHFRHAAERLGITQSAVSQQIAALETELGAPLFERIGRRVFPDVRRTGPRGRGGEVLSAMPATRRVRCSRA
jgi:hypothetical protein